MSLRPSVRPHSPKAYAFRGFGWGGEQSCAVFGHTSCGPKRTAEAGHPIPIHERLHVSLRGYEGIGGCRPAKVIPRFR